MSEIIIGAVFNATFGPFLGFCEGFSNPSIYIFPRKSFYFSRFFRVLFFRGPIPTIHGIWISCLAGFSFSFSKFSSVINGCSTSLAFSALMLENRVFVFTSSKSFGFSIHMNLVIVFSIWHPFLMLSICDLVCNFFSKIKIREAIEIHPFLLI